MNFLNINNVKRSVLLHFIVIFFEEKLLNICLEISDKMSFFIGLEIILMNIKQPTKK